MERGWRQRNVWVLWGIHQRSIWRQCVERRIGVQRQLWRKRYVGMVWDWGQRDVWLERNLV